MRCAKLNVAYVPTHQNRYAAINPSDVNVCEGKLKIEFTRI